MKGGANVRSSFPDTPFSHHMIGVTFRAVNKSSSFSVQIGCATEGERKGVVWNVIKMRHDTPKTKQKLYKK